MRKNALVVGVAKRRIKVPLPQSARSALAHGFPHSAATESLFLLTPTSFPDMEPEQGSEPFSLQSMYIQQGKGGLP